MSAPQVINGTLCYNCDDVDRARKAQRLGVPTEDIGPTGDVKQSSDKALSAKPVFGKNDPLTSGDRGRTLNVFA